MLKIIFRILNKLLLLKVNRFKTPTNLIFFLTNRCNARCPHCFYWKKLNDNSDELTTKEIKKTANNLDDCRSIALTGGEPTLREDLLDVCQIFLNKIDSLSLLSNGLLPKTIYSVLKEISQNQRKKIHLQLSIEGLKDIQDTIRGEGAFEKVIETIDLVKTLKNIKIILVTTVSKLNRDELTKMISFFSRYNLEHRFNITRGIDNSLFNLREDLINYHNPYEPDKVFLSLEEIEEVYDNLLDLNRIYNFWTENEQLVMKYSIEILKAKKKILPCFAAKLEAVIYPNGDVAFCEFMKPFSNLKNYNYDFKKIWSSKEADFYRKYIKHCFCLHSCNISTALNFEEGILWAKINNRKLSEKFRFFLSLLL